MVIIKVQLYILLCCYFYPIKHSLITTMTCTEIFFKHLLNFSDFVSSLKKEDIKQICTSSWEDLHGLSPPRKSALSVWRWQLLECRSLPWRLANSWQTVVLPQLQIKHKDVRLANSWQIVVLTQLQIKHDYVCLKFL